MSLRKSLVLFLLLACLGACATPTGEKRTVLVVGIDGADWRVIEPLWEKGRLPNLKGMSENAVRARLTTGYGSKSPVVWNTMATGVRAERHGITDFVVSTSQGDVPVSSSIRKVPAIWNMASSANLRVALLGWWASWPAEDVNGIVVSDRAGINVVNSVRPEAWLPRYQEIYRTAEAEVNHFPENLASGKDHLFYYVARQVLSEDYDLVLVYFRSVDVVSHHYWKYFRPDAFGPIDPHELDRYRDYIPSAYEAVDRALGNLVEAAGPQANVFVVSDHGFYGLKAERVRIRMDFDRVLNRLGFLEYSGKAVDPERSVLITHATPFYNKVKKVRFLKPPDSAKRRAVLSRLEAALSGITYESGRLAFKMRSPTPEETQGGADVTVEILEDRPSERLLVEGEPFEGAVKGIERISGSHGGGTPGIFLAAGPDIDPEASARGIDIHDITPTLLFALGLPVAEDFDGKAWISIFTETFRSNHPLKTIPSWGTREHGDAPSSSEDEKLKDELRALGYLN